MCGIFAISRAPESSIPDARRFILAGLLAIESRGYDSVGIAYTRGQQKYVWYDKQVGPASKVARHLDLGTSRAPIRSAIGHTRWSTQGEHTYDNAHPVVAANIVLVHNGVINDGPLTELITATRVGEVDSWALAGLIHNHAAIEAPHPCDVLALVEGDAAVAWYDSFDPALIHLARLVGRPMTLGWTKRGDLVMSSTRQTMRQTERLSGVTINDLIDVPEHTYLAVREGKIVEWRTIGKPEAVTPVPTRQPRQLALPTVVRTEVPGKRGSRRKGNVTHPSFRRPGITDLVETRPQDWWDEAERLLGDDWADDNWPSGTEIIRRRPRNGSGW